MRGVPPSRTCRFIQDRPEEDRSHQRGIRFDDVHGGLWSKLPPTDLLRWWGRGIPSVGRGAVLDLSEPCPKRNLLAEVLTNQRYDADGEVTCDAAAKLEESDWPIAPRYH